MADGDGLLEEIGKPLGGGRRITREGEGFGWDFAAVPRNGKGDGGEVRCESRADQVNGRSALAVHPLARAGTTAGLTSAPTPPEWTATRSAGRPLPSRRNFSPRR